MNAMLVTMWLGDPFPTDPPAHVPHGLIKLLAFGHGVPAMLVIFTFILVGGYGLARLIHGPNPLGIKRPD
jgi:hypothetical protein